MDHLRAAGVPGAEWSDAGAAANHLLQRVHTAEHLNRVAALSRSGGWFDPDTYVRPGSDEVARRAVGAAATAVDAIAVDGCTGAFAIARPPGHHATAARAMGFCLYSSAAIAVRHAQQDLGLRRVAVVDVDVHHGNGTESIFWDDPDVLYASLHQEPPFYPGTGRTQDVGGPGARGSTLNVPLPAGTGPERWLEAVDQQVVPALRAFAPALVLVSCGFDGHRDDPLGGFLLETSTYGALAQRLCDLRELPAAGRTVWVLEGGYDLAALATGVETVVRALVEA